MHKEDLFFCWENKSLTFIIYNISNEIRDTYLNIVSKSSNIAKVLESRISRL